MIKKLYVADYALIDNLTLTPSSSMNIITGETGAGKSIILGALSLVMGERADTSVLRNEGRKCVIEATIDIGNYNLKDFYEENDLDYENPTIIRREIAPNGKSRAFINDTPVLLDTLSSLAGHLIDIHSQHQNLSLSHHQYRTAVLDSYCGNAAFIDKYRMCLSQYKMALERYNTLIEKEKSLSREDEFNRFLLEELNAAALSIGEEEATEELIERLSNAQKIKEALWESHLLFNSEKTGVIENVRKLKNELSSINRFLPSESAIDSRMENIYIELKDIAGDINSIIDDIDEDPSALSRAEERLSLIHNLYRKHSVSSIEELLEIKKRLDDDVAMLIDMDSEIKEARKIMEESLSSLKESSENLYHSRAKGAALLGKEIEDIIHILGMGSARLDVQVIHSDSFNADGGDTVNFAFCANAGSQMAALEKTASGGELSRVMMALKCVLASKAHLPTLVLDEIDTGISGEVAMKMAQLMQDMSRNMQLIVITHLPQIASRGDLHFKVYKELCDGSTYTRMRSLTETERITEIAQMISGSDVGESAISHARELLKKQPI
ncbi:MAG: DNA repair protein RecN [Flavobacteriales bacterium]|nr:DNA repair protein RecN [Flavobacteriales bacterium]